jgi:flagellar hook-associated protein 3 FlgL
MTARLWRQSYKVFAINCLTWQTAPDGNGRYIFGGYKTDTPPFDASGAYNGGSVAISQQVDASRSMVIAHTGDQVFNSITSNAIPEPVVALRKPTCSVC